jgi:endonuclease III
MKKPTIRQVLNRLEKQYSKRMLVPSREPVAELVQTILSQNTSDTNSRPAFQALTSTFGSWENIMNADTSLVVETIRQGGLGQIKAERIQKALREIKLKRGKVEIDFLANLPILEAREWLKELPGVGNKTANCVLLFALGKPALPVDTHIFRVAKRLNLIPDKASLDEAHESLEKQVESKDIYEFHVLMIEHGREICRAQRPRCPQCILRKICPSFSLPLAPHAEKIKSLSRTRPGERMKNQVSPNPLERAS